MKNFMKKISIATLLCAGSFMLFSCGNGGNESETTDSTGTDTSAMDTTTAVTEAPVNMDTAKLVKDDSTFVLKAADGGMTEIEASKVAQTKATNQRVKDFSAMMIADHTKAGDKLKGLVTPKGITPPATLSKSHQSAVDNLSKKSGADFDKAYMSMMLDDHKKTVADFQKEAGNAKDEALKTFVSSTLPTLQMHLDSATAISNSLKK